MLFPLFPLSEVLQNSSLPGLPTSSAANSPRFRVWISISTSICYILYRSIQSIHIHITIIYIHALLALLAMLAICCLMAPGHNEAWLPSAYVVRQRPRPLDLEPGATYTCIIAQRWCMMHRVFFIYFIHLHLLWFTCEQACTLNGLSCLTLNSMAGCSIYSGPGGFGKMARNAGWRGTTSKPSSCY